jgi:hypothetical protein
MQWKEKFPQEIKKICLCSPFDAIKKPLSSSPLSRLFATALFFVGLTLTMIPPSSVIAFADAAQGTASSNYHFITTSDTVSSIPLSIEDEDETEEDEEDEESPLRVAFVKPSFTFAAYQLNGFYNFYGKAPDQAEGTTNVTTDLNLLRVRIPDGPYLYYKDDPFDSPRIPSQLQYYNTLMELVEDKASSQNLAIDIADITDKEVHEGGIFDSAGNNVYDVLFLFHQEYVTQAEYDNLKKFVVQNGGTIVFNDANVFTTEVKYDSAINTVTLVRGHGWAYNGISAWHAENERWLNENQQWVGSNFIEIPANENVTFSNNPFNYDHSEEQIVTNPNARIIFDFGVIEHTPYEIGEEIDNEQHFPNFGKVAVYEMISGKGKVINIGIYAHKLEDNEAFLDFYEEEILSRAIDMTSARTIGR